MPSRKEIAWRRHKCASSTMVATHAPSPEPATTAEMAETAFAEIFAAVIVNVILNPQSSQSLSLRSQVSHLHLLVAFAAINRRGLQASTGAFASSSSPIARQNRRGLSAMCHHFGQHLLVFAHAPCCDVASGALRFLSVVGGGRTSPHLVLATSGCTRTLRRNIVALSALRGTECS